MLRNISIFKIPALIVYVSNLILFQCEAEHGVFRDECDSLPERDGFVGAALPPTDLLQSDLKPWRL